MGLKEYRYYHSELELKYYDPGNEWIFLLTSASKNINATI